MKGLSLALTPASDTEKNILSITLVCNTMKIHAEGDWPRTTYDTDSMFPTSSTLGTISFMLTVDLANKKFNAEFLSDESSGSMSDSSTLTQSWTFDSTTKINICSGVGSASPRACTVSNFELFDEYFTALYPYGYVSMATAELYSFYTLIDGSLKNSFGSAGSAYFGDKASSPTAGTSPSWDSEKEYVQMTAAGQFLSFPLPSTLEPSLITTSSSISVAAWVKISTISTAKATIFSFHKADVDQSTKGLVFTAATETLYGPAITLDTWHLVGFSLSIRTDGKGALGVIFVDSTPSEVRTGIYLTTVIDISNAAVLRVNGASDSFIGNVFGLRIMSPGGGFLNPFTVFHYAILKK